jgi:polyisoprenoid-binding protein YceI
MTSPKPTSRAAVVLAAALAFSMAACAQEEQSATENAAAPAGEDAETIVLAQADEVAPAADADAETTMINVPSGTYTLDKTHAYLTFTYSHLGFSRPVLAFRDFDATINFDADNPANSSVSATINVDSVDTGVGDVSEFEEHIRDERFLDTATSPTATFESTAVAVTGENTGTVTGDLTIRGTTLPVTLDVVLRKADEHPMRRTSALGFSASTTINRSDFGAGAFTPNVSDEVEISFEGEFALASD